MKSLKKLAAICAAIMVSLFPQAIHAEEEEVPADDPAESAEPHHCGGCLARPHFEIVTIILKEEPKKEEPPLVLSDWVSVGIGDFYADFLPSGSELVLPEMPGVRGYTFGSGEIDVLPGAVVPVWDSVWVFPVY